MYSVVSIHTLCIIFIEYYNWKYYIDKDKCIKDGIPGIIYQAIKFIVLIIDLIMLYQLWSFIFVYLSKAKTLTQNNKKRIWLFIKILLILNGVWLILRCFVQNLSSYLTPHGILIFNYIHSYRYAIQSAYDFINGFAILYGLYKVSMYAQIRRRNSSAIGDDGGFRSSKKPKNKFDELLNESRMFMQDEPNISSKKNAQKSYAHCISSNVGGKNSED